MLTVARRFAKLGFRTSVPNSFFDVVADLHGAANITPFGVLSTHIGVRGRVRFSTLGRVIPMLMEQKLESPGQAVRQARKARGWSQTKLAQEVGTKQQTIGKIEKGTIKYSSVFPRIAHKLNVSLPALDPSLPKNAFGGVIPGEQLTGDKDLRVHAAAAGGRGAIIVSTDPVEWVARPQPLLTVKDGYGIIIIESSMAPEFEPGDTALIHPHLPPTIGSTCVFYAEREDGTVEAVIKRLRRFTGDCWYVEQFSPKRQFTLKRGEWQKCHVTVGKYSRR